MSNLSEKELSNRMILIINGLKECLDYNCNKRKENQIEIKYDIETLETMIDLYNKEKEKNKKAIEMLQEHIKHCEQEAKGSLNNEICHIALEFDKHILQELLQEGDK